MSETKKKLFVCIFIGLLFTIIYIVFNPVVTDSDPYWHVALGKYIVKHKSLMTLDEFSWWGNEQGYIETAHSWLFSVILYLFSLLPLSINNIFVIYTGFCCFILILIFLNVYSKLYIKKTIFYSKNLLYFLLMAFFIAFGIKLVARPLSFSLILFLLFMLLLQDVLKNPFTKLWILIIPLSCLYANIHGGAWVIIPCFSFLFFLFSLCPSFEISGFQHINLNKKQCSIKMFLLFIGSIIGGVINPYGFKLFIYPFITNSSVQKAYTLEFQPISINIEFFICSLLMIFIFFVFRSRIKISLSYVIPVLLWFIVTLRYCRFALYLNLCLVMLLMECFPKVINTFEINPPNRFFVKIVNKCACIGLFFVLLFLMFLKSYEKVDPITESLENEIKSYNLQRMYCDFNLGGFLIYHDIKSFIDSRGDLFSDEDIEGSYLFFNRFLHDEDIKDYIDYYNFDSFLLEDGSICDYLDNSKDWKKVYEEYIYKLYIKV